MWDDEMAAEDVRVEPIRAKIEAIAFLLWKEQADLPKEVEDAIADVMQDIKGLID